MSQALIESVEQQHLKTDLPEIAVGQTVDVHCRIIEGDKERVQVFQGVIIAIKGRGINRTFTVRRIVAHEGVERIFPVHSPRIAKIEIVRHGKARRAKLYYLRDRIGKSRRLADRSRGLQHIDGIRPSEGKKKKAAAAESKAAKDEAVASGEGES